jgi:hypothetical protein
MDELPEPPAPHTCRYVARDVDFGGQSSPTSTVRAWEALPLITGAAT